MFTDENVGGVDRICACKLAEGMMLSLRGHADQYVVAFVSPPPVYYMQQKLTGCRLVWPCEH
jgi:hypothetical protein